MRTIPVVAAVCLVGALLLVGRTNNVTASPRPTEALVANVDLQALVDQSDARKEADVKVREFGAVMFKRFDETSKLKYLTLDEISEYSAALNADPQSDAHKQKVVAIRAESARRADEASTIAAKAGADLTPADKARVTLLSDMEQVRPVALERLNQLYRQNVNTEEARLRRLTLVAIREAVGKVAKEQGFTQVFDTSSLVYSSVDLTPLALVRVRKPKS